ncbi:methylenetetrahydrofolate reduct, partial [Violaceomyces palustris]
MTSYETSSSSSSTAATSRKGLHPSHVVSRIAQARSSSESKPFWTLEFFPPKTQQGLANLYARIARMSTEVRPSWIHVTWGAGGTTGDWSLELAARVQSGNLNPAVPLSTGPGQDSPESVAAKVLGLENVKELKRFEHAFEQPLDTCLHLTCTNVRRQSLDETLDRAKLQGIRNILALRGDPPRGEEYWVASDDRFQHATDLVRYIRERHGDFFCIGVAAYPEGHADYVDRDLKRDMEYLKAKQDAGAEFAVTQLFYDVDRFLEWYRDCRRMGITIPILPGIMPIQNYQSFRRMTNLCKAEVPRQVLDDLEPIKSDDAAVKEYGVSLSINMIGRIYLESDIRGFHLCTLNLEKSVQRVLEGLGWVSSNELDRQEKEGGGVETASGLVERFRKNQMISDRSGNMTPKDLKTTTQEALKRTLARTRTGWPSPETSTWDEFPNGRYGDSRSPAFGEMDGYGVSLKVAPSDALRIWGRPETTAEISNIFASYLMQKIDVIPWCDAPLMAETLSIRPYLLSLNLEPGAIATTTTAAAAATTAGGGSQVVLEEEEKEVMFKGGCRNGACKGWWTVGSQPAVDGAPSSDPVYGFGPKGGFVFQKAFVELFMEEEDKDQLVRKIKEEGEGLITFYAGNRK